MGLKSSTLQHSLPTQTLDTAHKCIPNLRKIGYQRRGKYDFLPADVLSQKRGLHPTPTSLYSVCAVEEENLCPRFFFLFCFFRTHWMDDSQIFLAELKLAWQRFTVRSPVSFWEKKHMGKCSWASHGALFAILVFGLTTPNGWMLSDTQEQVHCSIEIVKTVIWAGFL